MRRGRLAEPLGGVPVRMYPSLFREGVPGSVPEQCSLRPFRDTVPEEGWIGALKNEGTVFPKTVPGHCSFIKKAVWG